MWYPDSQNKRLSWRATVRSGVLRPNLISKSPLKRLCIILVTSLRVCPIPARSYQPRNSQRESFSLYVTIELSNNMDAPAKIAISTPIISIPPFAFLSMRRGKRCYATCLTNLYISAVEKPPQHRCFTSWILHPIHNQTYYSTPVFIRFVQLASQVASHSGAYLAKLHVFIHSSEKYPMDFLHPRIRDTVLWTMLLDHVLCTFKHS